MESKKKTNVRHPFTNLKPSEYEQYLDTQSFSMYAIASIIILIVSLLINMKFYLYGLVPLALSNFVGVYSEEKNILLALNISYFVVLTFFRDSINLLR